MTSIFSLVILGIFTINFVACLPAIDNASYNATTSKLQKSSVCTTPVCKKAESSRLHEQLKDLIENGIQENDPQSFKKMKLFYEMCMDEEQIEKNANKEYLELINKLGGWPILLKDLWNESSFDWLETLYKFKEADLPYDFFFALGYGIDIRNNSRRCIHFDQPPFGIEASLLAEGLDNFAVYSYRWSMVHTTGIFGAVPYEILKELSESFNLEIELAKISQIWNKEGDINKMYNAMTFKEFETNYPGIPYFTYVKKMLSPHVHIDFNDIVIVHNPTYFSKLADLLSTVPKRTQANYLFWRQTVATAEVLGKGISRFIPEQRTMDYNIDETNLNLKKCLYLTRDMFIHAISALYIKRYFDKETKQSAIEMTDNIRESFKKMISEVTWMDKTTKQRALEKFANTKPNLAYPDELLDEKKLDKLYAPLKLYPESFLKTYISLLNYSLALTFERLSKPINETNWLDHSTVTMINAYYNPTENSINIPAAILQGQFFNKDYPKYMNYAGIGSIVGHEIAHGFDIRGSLFDKNGNLIDWWDPETKKRYLERAQCIVDQYNNYTIEEIGIHLDGYKTQRENIADNGGLKEAYYAYKAFENENGVEPHLPGLESYSSRQMFWLSNANMWCMKYQPEILKHIVLTVSHTPNEFRIIGTMSNLPEFSKDFNCPLGSPMNPEKKCTVW